MVNFIDLIKDIKGKKALNASNQADLEAYNKLLAGEDIDVQPTQQVVQQPVKQDTLLMGPDGKVDYNASVRLKQQTTPLSLADRLIGREVHIDKETVDPKTNEITTQRFSDYKPGFLNDFSAGYRENAATPISFNNFGQNKNPATRFGEFAGTAARMLDNPLVRGAIAYGLSNSMGDRRPLVQALNATVGTQQNRMKDRLYRDSLIEQMQNSIMNQEGFAELKPEEQQTLLRKAANRVNSYRGFIGDDTYKQILTGMQLQDNAAYRNALLKTQMNNQIIDNLLAQQKFAYQKQQDAIANQQKNRQLDIEASKINQPKPLSDSQVKDLKGTTDFINSLENIESRYGDKKYNSMFGLKGDIRRNNPLSRYDAEASLFKQDVEILRQRYAKLLEGGRLSDSDRAFYQKALFNPNVSRADFLEAVRRMKATLIQDYSNALSMYSKQGKDITGFEVTPTQSTNYNTINIINKLKANGYSDSDIAEYLKMKGY